MPWRPRPLTDGQLRLRDIVSAVARRNSSACAREKDLRASLAADPIVATDAITGRRLDRPLFARSYRAAIRDTGRTWTPSDRAVPLDHLILIRDEFREAYDLGPKYWTTASALFALAEGRTLCGQGWGLTVYLADDQQITVVSSGGCHRSLAHFLYGVHDVGADHITFWETASFDSALNAALLFFEQTAGTELLGDRPRAILKDLYLSVPRRDLCTVSSYLGLQIHDYALRLHPTEPATALVALLAKLADFRGESTRPYLVPWWRNRRLHHLRSSDPFIRWYQDRAITTPDPCSTCPHQDLLQCAAVTRPLAGSQ